jgi:hypothetical protein
MRLALVLLMAFAGAVSAKDSITVRQIRFEIERKADGKKYPLPVKEGYTLDEHGALRYSAYFGNMPTNMNHNDSIEWKSESTGAHLVDTAIKLYDQLTVLPDDKQAPNGELEVYLVDFTKSGKGSRRYVLDHKATAWGELDGAFQAMVTAFEKATGRPKKPNELPQ